MINLIIFIAVALIASVLAFFVGKRAGKFIMLRNYRRLIKEAQEVIGGKRKNEMELDGKMVEVKQFVITDKDNVDRRVDLLGNEIKEITNG